jgi:hypothetical protein
MKFIFKIVLTSVICINCGSALAANWVFLGKNQNEGVDFYLNFEALDYQSNIVKYQVRSDFPGPKQFQGYTYYSILSTYESSCSEGAAKIISRTFLGQRFEPLNTDYPQGQAINLSANPNGILTTTSDGLCELSKLKVKNINLSITQNWDEDLLFDSNNTPTSINRYQVASKSIQKIGNFLLITQMLTYNQAQPIGSSFYKNLVAISAFDCSIQQRSGFILGMNYESEASYAKAVGVGGSGKASSFTPFAKAENTAKFANYCQKLSDPVAPPATQQRPANPMPSNGPKQPTLHAPSPSKSAPVKSDSLL